MASKQQDAIKSDISPVLFMSMEGEPMSFFLRPGPIKCKLQPLITAGGGLLCKSQQPGAILLLDPTERDSIAETTAHWYVSTQYIYDCIERDEQLDLEDYRLNSEVVQGQSAQLKNTKESTPGAQGGRLAYTAEEDAAILNYVSKYKTEVGGNRVWQEMEKQRLTSHSWQSMKYRYRVRLAKTQSENQEEAEEAATTEDDAKAAEEESTVKENQEPEKPSSAENAVSAETDLTQIDAQSVPVENTRPEAVEAETSNCPENKPTDEIKEETAEAETCNSPQPEEPCTDPPTGAQPIPAESTEAEMDESQTIVSEHDESAQEASPSAELLPNTSPQKKPKEKKKSSPALEQPRRMTRRQLQLEESLSSRKHGKKLRTSSTKRPLFSPKPPKKTKAVFAPQKNSPQEEPPAKKAKTKSVAAEPESQQEESGQPAVPETPDTETISMPETEEKTEKENRKVGILRLATTEFDSESDEDEAPAAETPTETVTVNPAQPEPPLPPPNTAASTQPRPEPEPDLQEVVQETPASSSDSEAAAAKAVGAPPKPHLFIFDSESQEEEEESQSIVGNRAAAPARPTASKNAAFSLTQVQLEEDKQRIRELMKETNQDLACVTKALLKTSGDFSEARDLLLNPRSIATPLWQSCDDELLLLGDDAGRQQLREKYSEELLAKRIVFLEIEG